MGRQPKDNYVKFRKGSHIPEYDRDVPADVRALVGKAKWKKSLRGLSLNDAKAKARELASEHDAVIARARKTASASMDSIREGVTLDERLLDLSRWIDQRASDASRLAVEAHSWRDFAMQEGPDDEIVDPDWAASTAAGLDGERLQIERQIARDIPELRAAGMSPELLRAKQLWAAADVFEANPLIPETITLGGVLERWKDIQKPSSPEQYEYPVKLFEELHGALPIRQIKSDHVREFRDALLQMPPASGGKFEGLTMQQVIQKAFDERLTLLKPSTAKKHFRCLRAIFSFAFDDQYIDSDVAAGLKWRGPKEKHSEAKRERRRTFSPAEMVRLFNAASNHNWHDAEENLWFLRLATYTGARGEELAQLSQRDVVTIGGVLCLSLHDEGDNRIKNRSSVRNVPVHPELIRLGFTQFADRASNRHYLFASLEADGRGRRYGRMLDRLTRLIDGHVTRDPRVVPHSLRHGMKDALRLVSGYDREIAEMIMGHRDARHQTGSEYGSNQIAVMYDLLSKTDPFDVRRVVSDFEDHYEEQSALDRLPIED